jgi:hypothetical protein
MGLAPLDGYGGRDCRGGFGSSVSSGEEIAVCNNFHE